MVVSWKQEALELGCFFYSSAQMEMNKKNYVHLNDLMFLSEFQKWFKDGVKPKKNWKETRRI